MSFKSKNLTVNSEEPAFLRRLRGEVGESGDRHSQPVARPQRARLEGDDDDDAPTYVDESTNDTLSKAQVDELKGKPAKEVASKLEAPTQAADESSKNLEAKIEEAKKEKGAQIGVTGKRRIAKVVGEGETDEAVSGQDKTKKVKKTAGKKTKVKLSFDDE